MSQLIPLNGGNPYDTVALEEHRTPYRGIHIASVLRNGTIRVAPNYEADRKDLPVRSVMVDGGWRLLVAANAVEQWAWRCDRCRWGPNVKHADVPAEIRTGKPRVHYELIDNYSANPTPCDHCGERNGVEVHHWAPSHLFEDSHTWPTGLLCRACHTEWHRRTRTGAFYRAQRTA